MPTWSWIDGAILVILGLSVITGLVRGFVKELIGLSVWVLGVWLAIHYYQTVATWLAPYIHDKFAQNVSSVVLIMLGVVLAGSLINILVSFVLNTAGLSGTDRLLGMLFGFIRGILIVSVLILAAKMTALIPTAYQSNSMLYAKFDPVVNWLASFAPDVMNQIKKLDENTKEKEQAKPSSSPTKKHS